MPKSNLDLINDTDSFPYYTTSPSEYLASISTYYSLRVAGHDYTLGYVLPSVASVFRGIPHWDLDDEARTLTLVSGSTEPERSAIVAQTCLALRSTGHFKVLEKWRDELYPVYGRNREVLFTVERAASPLLGVVTYGVHMTAYTRVKDSQDNSEMTLWIPRRAKTKHTYGGMLDNAVAGGIAFGEQPLESLVRECAEEASLPDSLVRANVKPRGTVTYFYIRDASAGGETNLLQPECQYVYDLELPSDVTPKPGDDEVEQFYLMSVDEVKAALARGEFKPNTALVQIEFFIRHGILTPENERDYIEICSRVHRRLEFPTV